MTGPYNYPFSDNISEQTSAFVCQTQLSDVSATPFFGWSQLQVVSSGLVLTGSWDIWGWSKDLQFYIKPTTLRLTEGGGAVITSRANVQRVIHEFTTWYSGRMSYYRQQNKFPINGPVEIRCCGLDQESEVKVPSAGSPTISSMRPRPDHPDWNTAIWLNVLCIPNTPGMWAAVPCSPREVLSVVASSVGDVVFVAGGWPRAPVFQSREAHRSRMAPCTDQAPVVGVQ